MKSRNAWLLAAIPLLVSLLSGALLDLLLDLTGARRVILWVGLVVLGLVAGVLLFLYLRGRARPGAERPRADEEVDGAFATARARLKTGGVGRLTERPVLLVFGPAGGAKSSVVVNSGLDPELLAGEVWGAGAVVPTRATNLWLADGAVLAEVGPPVLEAPARWARVLAKLRPPRLGAAFAGKTQPPRAAIVCFPCDELLKPNAGQEVVAAARRLRERLLEAAGAFGVRLPVYVLFTKVDRIPFFDDYVRDLAREEAQQPLGVTLPLARPEQAGTRAERDAERVRGALRGLLDSLAAFRLDVLPRGNREESRSGAYEFPRELQKVAELVSQFLLEVTRPAQLGVSPFLRGFYFTGVRPVFLQEGGAPEHPPAAGRQVALGATSVFDAAALRAAIESRPAPGGTRKVPEWVFVRRLFRDIVLADRAALGLTARGTRVDALRRAAAAAAAVTGLVLAVGFIVSYVQNREVLAESLAAARGAETMEVEAAGAPSLEALERLDRVRGDAATLRGYEVEGPPLRLAWGLYAGDDALVELRRLYFDRFDRLLWGSTRGALLGTLASLPETPQETTEYGATYDALKAHLVTTSHPQYSTAEFLAPVLLRHWPAAGVAGPEREGLARAQFAFFGSELPHGVPYQEAPDETLVARTRTFLARFAGEDALYQAVLSEASRDASDVEFGVAFPGTETVVRNPYVVPAAFTSEGWDRVQAGLRDLDSLLDRETWVVGERTVPAAERARLAREIDARYRADYAAHWREFLQRGQVVGYAGARDAAQKLERLSGNQSPLLQMLALASRNTAVDSVVIGQVFQPLHVVMPPGQTDRYVGESNQGYVGALVALQSAMGQIAAAPPPVPDAALAQATASAEQVRVQVRQIAQAFRVDEQSGPVGQSLERLMQAPVGNAESFVRGLPTGAANQSAAAFCRVLRPVLAKYPFASGAREEATMEEVAQLFQPGASVLWSFYDGSLQGLLARQGSRYAPRVGATPAPSPAFVSFFNLAADVSGALFDPTGAGPALSLLFRAQTSADLPEVTVEIDGQRQTFTRTVAAARGFEWAGSRAQTARITATTPGGTVTFAEAPAGPWALFRVLQQAEWARTGDNAYRLTWRVPASPTPLVMDLNLAGAPVPMPGFLDRLDCVSQLVQ